MTKKFIAGGCSFTLGNELSDDVDGKTPSKKAWASRIADNTAMEYHCTAFGGLESLETVHTVLLQKGPKRVSPLFPAMLLGNLATGHVSMRFGALGPSNSSVTACATSCAPFGSPCVLIRMSMSSLISQSVREKESGNQRRQILRRRFQRHRRRLKPRRPMGRSRG